MTTILLIRHADVHNPGDVLYGRLPRFRLSADGVRQAEATAEALAGETLAAIYTSPMLRARQTARIIARHHPDAPLRAARALIEVRTGWEGTPWTELDRDTNLYDPPKRPDDENIVDIADRMGRFLRLLAGRHAGRIVACVSHGDPIIIARVLFEGGPLTLAGIRPPEYPERASVTRLRLTPDGALEGVEYASPAQHLVTPYQAAKREVPAEASGEAPPGSAGRP